MTTNNHHLWMLIDEIFGEKNIVANFTWWSKYTLSNDSKTVSCQHENILSDAKNLNVCKIGVLARTPEMDKSYKIQMKILRERGKQHPCTQKTVKMNIDIHKSSQKVSGGIVQ